MVSARSINSQRHDDPQSSGVVAALDNLAESSVAAPPRDAKRWTESGSGLPTSAKLKRQELFRLAEDSDDELLLRTSAPNFCPTLRQSATAFSEVIVIDTDDDDFGSLRYQSVTPRKRIWKTKNKSYDEVIEISD